VITPPVKSWSHITGIVILVDNRHYTYQVEGGVSGPAEARSQPSLHSPW